MIHLICTLEPARISFIPQFVEHYSLLGVGTFHLSVQVEPEAGGAAVNCAEAAAVSELSRYGIRLAGTLVEPFSSFALRAHHDRIQDAKTRPSDWIIWADIDEFHVYPGDFKSLLQFAESMNIDYFHGRLVERAAADGKLKNFDPAQPLWTQYPRRFELSDTIVPGISRKVPCARANIRVNPGHHFPASAGPLRYYADAVEVHHFKWDDSVVQRLSRRLQPDFRERCPWWVESRNVIDYIERNGFITPEIDDDVPLRRGVSL
ncbi:MAG: hypothetical protein H7Y20_16030 [Bryobacteraceae bacterium]|nr:hypothetical protein [Bryobacteraceae bacterium]